MTVHCTANICSHFEFLHYDSVRVLHRSLLRELWVFGNRRGQRFSSPRRTIGVRIGRSVARLLFQNGTDGMTR